MNKFKIKWTKIVIKFLRFSIFNFIMVRCMNIDRKYFKNFYTAIDISGGVCRDYLYPDKVDSENPDVSSVQPIVVALGTFIY